MKRFIGVMAIGALVFQGGLTRFSPSPAAAESKGGSGKIGVVDLQRIIAESKEGIETKKKVEEYYSKKQQELNEAQQDAMKAEKEFYEQKMILTEEAAQKKEEEIARRKIQLKRMLEDADYGLESYQDKLFAGMRSRIFKLIEKMGKDEGFTLVLNKAVGVVLYTDTSADIADQVIKKFDSIKVEGVGSGEGEK